MKNLVWDDDVDDEPLIEDNAPGPVAPYPHPEIPAELPGIELERDYTELVPTPAVVAEEDSTNDLLDDRRIRRAAANADVHPNLIFGDAEDDRSGLMQQQLHQHN